MYVDDENIEFIYSRIFENGYVQKSFTLVLPIIFLSWNLKTVLKKVEFFVTRKGNDGKVFVGG